MLLSRKVEIDPTVEQRKILERYCGIRRLVFNAALAEMNLRIEKQEAEKQANSKPKLTQEELKAKRLKAKEERLAQQAEKQNARKERQQIGGRKKGVPVKPDDGKPNWQTIHKTLLPKLRIEYPYLNDVSSLVLRESVADVGSAFQNYWRELREGKKKTIKIKSKKKKDEEGKPKFKSRFNTLPAFRMAQGNMIKVMSTHILIPSARKGPEIGWIKLKRKDYIPTENVRYTQAAFSKKANKWFVSVGISFEEKPRIAQGSVLGVDIGIRTLAAVSDGQLLGSKEDLKEVHRLELSLKRWQRRMSRRYEQAKKFKKKDENGHLILSKGFYEAKKQVQKLYYQITCARQNLTHQITHKIVTTPSSVIVLEDLNVEGMKKNRHLAPLLQTVGLYEFRRQIEYKAKIYGKQVIFAHPYFPSSKRCSHCGEYNDNLGSSKVFHCPHCGFTCDRDLNASYNLRDGYLLNLPDFLHGRSERTSLRVEGMQKEAEKSALTMPNGIDAKQVITSGLIKTIIDEGSNCLGNRALEKSSGTTCKAEQLVLHGQPEGSRDPNPCSTEKARNVSVASAEMVEKSKLNKSNNLQKGVKFKIKPARKPIPNLMKLFESLG